MLTLIARLKKGSTQSLSASQHSQSHASPATPIRHPMPGAWSELSPFPRKIHPNLNSLIFEDTTTPTILDIGPTPLVAQNETTLEFVPLPPSTRKRSASLRIRVGEDSDSNIEKTEAMEQPLQDVRVTDSNKVQGTDDQLRCIPALRTTSFPETASPPPDASFPNTSGETFGCAAKFASPQGQCPSSVVSDTRSTTPVTPDSCSSQAGNREARAYRCNRSRSESYSSHKLESTIPSPHTFGIPTPPSSGFTFSPCRRRVHASSETPPPLPPLDHPAFRSSLVLNNANDTKATRVFTGPGLLLENDNQQAKHPRHASSLPSMSRRVPSIKSPNRSRKRARTQSSRFKTDNISLSTPPPLQSTPRRSFRHLRTPSKESTKSSRRASAEFSAVQATLIEDDHRIPGSWEAQVSREMVRMSLARGEKPGRRYQNNAGAAELGQARGHNVRHVHLFLVFCSLHLFHSFHSLSFHISRYDNSRLKPRLRHPPSVRHFFYIVSV
jgi:hypothetical protein